VCRSSKTTLCYRLQDKLSDSGERFPLFLCSNCELLFLDPALPVERFSEFYPSGYWWQAEDSFSFFEKIYRETIVKLDQLRFVSSIFPRYEEVRLLDVGCGNGLFVKLAREKGFDAWGLESSPEAVGIAQKDGIDTLRCGSIDDLIREKKRFNLITLFHCLEHLRDPLQYLRKISLLLNPPGDLVIQVPNRASLQAKILGSDWNGLDCPRHVCNFNSRSLEFLFDQAGLQILRRKHFSLRDNAASLVSSSFPGLDPMRNKVISLKRSGRRNSLAGNFKSLTYLGLLLLAQPAALFEAILRRGATLTVYARFRELKRTEELPFESSGTGD
jgi:SAM-dependent methyltransferase